MNFGIFIFQPKQQFEGLEEAIWDLVVFLRREHPSAAVSFLNFNLNIEVTHLSAEETHKELVKFLQIIPKLITTTTITLPQIEHIICIAIGCDLITSFPCNQQQHNNRILFSTNTTTTTVYSIIENPQPLLEMISHSTGGVCISLKSTTGIISSFKELTSHHLHSLGPIQLALGHLSSAITLSPDPYLSLIHSQRSLIPTFPTSIGIIGFVQTKILPAPQSISAHIIVPFNKKPQEKSPLCSILAHSLLQERYSAIVALGSKEWNGLITVPFSSPAVLVLHILKPGFLMPETLIPLHKLTVFSSIALVGQTKTPIELSYQQSQSMMSSYLIPPIMPNDNNVSVQNAIDRIKRLVNHLPSSQIMLQTECNALVSASHAFHMPSILQLVSTCIANLCETAEQKAHPTAPFLHDLSISLQNASLQKIAKI